MFGGGPKPGRSSEDDRASDSKDMPRKKKRGGRRGPMHPAFIRNIGRGFGKRRSTRG